MRFRSLSADSTSSSPLRRHAVLGGASPLTVNRLSSTLRSSTLLGTTLGTTLGAGALIAGPLYAAPTLGRDANGPQVQILSPGYQNVLKGKFRILIAIKSASYNPATIELFVDDKAATNGPIKLTTFPSSSFDWDTSQFADGPHKLLVRVTDTQGFRGWAEVNIFINNNRVVDTTPPSLSFQSIKPFETLSGTTQVELQGMDNFGVKWIYVSLSPVSATTSGTSATPATGSGGASGTSAAGLLPTSKKPAPLRSWLLNKPPYVVEFDTTRIPDGVYKFDAKAYDDKEQQGDAKSITVGVVNNSINATSIGGLLDGLKSAEADSDPPSKTPASSTGNSTPDQPYGQPLPLDVPDVTDNLSGTDAGNIKITPPKGTNKTVGHGMPNPVGDGGTRFAKQPLSLIPPDLSRMRAVNGALTGAATTESPSVASGNFAPRIAYNVPSTGRVFADGQLSSRTSGGATLLARSDATPTQPNLSVLPGLSGSLGLGLASVPMGILRVTEGPVAPAVSPLRASLGAAPSLTGPVSLPTLPRDVATRVARASEPAMQPRQNVAALLSSPALSAASALSGAVAISAPTLVATPTIAPDARVAVPVGAPVVDNLSHTYIATNSVGRPPVQVGVKPMPMQRAAAALNALRDRVGQLTAKATNRVTGRATLPQTVALPRPETNGNSASSITAAITVSPLEVSEQVTIPRVYRVDRTTTLRSIAARYKLPVELVAACNGLGTDVRVNKGTDLKLPRPLQVTYAGHPVKGDVPSMMMGDTSMTAFRFLFEQAGGKLEWDAKNHRVLAHKGDSEIVLTIGSKTAKVNDRDVMLELAAFLFEGRTMVPVRFFEEGLNAQVQWDPQTGRLVVAMAN